MQILNFAIGKGLKHHNQASTMLYSWCDTESCQLFAADRPSYLTQRFQTLIHQSTESIVQS